MRTEAADAERSLSPWPNQPFAPVALFALIAAVVIAPAVRLGTGFYMDDWGDLGRKQTVGILRLAQAGKFASRPGAWAVETVSYGLLGAHPLLWLALLTVLATAIATCIWLLLARLIQPGLAVAAAGLWLLLPDHQSLRIFPNVTPTTTSLLLLLMGLLAFERRRPNWATLALCMGISCYESAYVPAVAGVLALHLLVDRGTRRQATIAVGGSTLTVALMAIHPTYALSSASIGMPGSIIIGQYATALTPSPILGHILLAILVAVAVLGVVLWRHGDPIATSGVRLMLAGSVVIALGLGGFVLKAPFGIRGINDRAFGVSSIGTSLVWIGAFVVLARPVLLRLAATVAFAVLLAAANVTFERDWSTVTRQTDRALHTLDHRYHGHPPTGLVVGPVPLDHGSVRSLHDIYIRDASLVVLGHSFTVTISETQQQWNATPPADRITWAQLLAS